MKNGAKGIENLLVSRYGVNKKLKKKAQIQKNVFLVFFT